MEKSKGKILWIDDEIELLRPHIILLEQRGYEIDTATNGEDAIEMVNNKHFDLIFLDEMMLGMSGLETLPILKELDSATPIVMVTKNEAESLMEEAIGSKIDDYLTKPVNPAQILAACKKFLEADKITTARFTQDYLQGFNELNMKMMERLNWNDWRDIYIKLVNWSMEIDRQTTEGLEQTLTDQFKNANAEYSKFVEDNYLEWVNKPDDDAPLMSHQILDKFLVQHLKTEGPTVLFVIDCMRLDQWLVMQELLSPYFTFKMDYYCSILPTATPYARNSIFAGLLPIDIKKYLPQYWVEESSNSEEHKLNQFEPNLLESWVERKRIKLNSKLNFIKIFDTDFGKKIEKEILDLTNSQLTAIVVNSVDMIAHSRSDYAILKEIAPDESAYRSLTRSWFQHSSLFGMFKILSGIKNIKIVVTTDHGSIRCMRGVKVLGDRDTSTNLRYKFGKNVKADSRNAMQISDPEKYKLPRTGITVNNIIAKEDFYFVYPTDYHYFLQRYRDSFQHGGISLEEMIIPIINLEAK
jgi:CheY-like chemotaxis protein